MTEPKMQDQEFENMLINSIAIVPPTEDVIKDVNPWRLAMRRIVFGLAFTLMTVDIYFVDEILSVAAAICLMLGFRALREENKSFKICFFLSVMNMVMEIGLAIVGATLWNQKLREQPVWDGIVFVNVAIGFLLIVFLRDAVRKVQKRAGVTLDVRPVTALLLWEIVTLIAAFSFSEGVFVWGLLISYCFIFYYLYKTFRTLEEAGYVLEPVKEKCSDAKIVRVCGLVLVIGLVVSYLCFGKYPVKWTENNEILSQDLQDRKKELSQMGFPERVLNDISREDLESCKNAKQVVTNEWLCKEDGFTDLRFIDVAVELQNDNWKIFQYFVWEDHPGYYGTEAIILWPSYKDRGESNEWTKNSDITGRVLFDRKGEPYIGDYYSIESENYSEETMLTSFFATDYSDDVTLSFSFPWTGEKCRGYITYETIKGEETFLFSSWVNYVHQKSILQYPVKEAKTRLFSFGDIAFDYNQHSFTFTFEEGEIHVD